MPRYVAFLRGINVGGHRVKMDRLRSLFEECRFGKVSTFIASGNVIFETKAADRVALEKRIEAALATGLGYETPTFLRTPEEIAAVTAHRAFPTHETEVEGHTVHVAFSRTALTPAAGKALGDLATAMDAFTVRGTDFYWLCRGKITESKVSPSKLNKAVGMPSTMRNMTMLRRLLENLGGGA